MQPGFPLREPRFLISCHMCDDSPPRLKAADLQKLAQQRLAELQAGEEELHPVINTTRKLARNFWSSAWMKQLAHCESGGMCLAPGRTLLRHGCVLDLRITPGCITALISAEELYEVELHINPLEGEQLETLSQVCSTRIDSLLALLEGNISPDVLQQLCHPDHGLLPTPQDWHMRCTCPDWAEPCPHAAAAIYAAGCMIDESPGLLFTLRGIEASALLQKPAASVPLDTEKLADIFGIDIIQTY